MTTSTPYAKDPHLDIQRALLDARHHGATKAWLTFDDHSHTAALDDNRNGDDPLHRQVFNTNIHPSEGYHWQTQQAMRHHIAPRGLETTLNFRYGNNTTRPHSLNRLGDNTLATANTPSGNHRIHLIKDRQLPSFTTVDPDGTTNVLRPELGLLLITSPLKAVTRTPRSSPTT